MEFCSSVTVWVSFLTTFGKKDEMSLWKISRKKNVKNILNKIDMPSVSRQGLIQGTKAILFPILMLKMTLLSGTQCFHDACWGQNKQSELTLLGSKIHKWNISYASNLQHSHYTDQKSLTWYGPPHKSNYRILVAVLYAAAVIGHLIPNVLPP